MTILNTSGSTNMYVSKHKSFDYFGHSDCPQEEFAVTKGAIRVRKSTKNRQHNG